MFEKKIFNYAIILHSFRPILESTDRVITEPHGIFISVTWLWRNILDVIVIDIYIYIYHGIITPLFMLIMQIIISPIPAGHIRK